MKKKKSHIFTTNNHANETQHDLHFGMRVVCVRVKSVMTKTHMHII